MIGREYADFASRRFARRLPLYLDREIPLQHVICYDGQTPVDNCDIFIDGTLMKIEDVDILEPHQRRGFASGMLSYIENYAYENKIDTLFLQMEQDNEQTLGLYRKLGYSCAGKNTIIELPVDRCSYPLTKCSPDCHRHGPEIVHRIPIVRDRPGV